MKARLTGHLERGRPRLHAFEQELVIGRSRECAFQVEDVSVSARHARIHYDEKLGRYVLEDLGSRSGTWLDGIEVAGPEPLGHLHVIRVGSRVELLFQDLERCALRHGETATPVGSGPPMPPKTGTEREEEFETTDQTVVRPPGPPPPDLAARHAAPSPPAPVPVDEPGPDSGEPVTMLGMSAPPAAPAPRSEPEMVFELVFDSDGQRYRIVPGANSIGRLPDNAVRRSNEQLSRLHAVISLREGRLFVRDEGSYNGTFVDDRRVEGEVEVAAGSRICFGTEDATVEAVGLPNDGPA